MKKLTFSLLTDAVLSLTVSSFGEEAVVNMTAIQNQLFKLESMQDSYKKQFAEAKAQIKNVEDSLPKLSKDIESQLNQLQKNNDAMLKEIKANNETQLKALMQQLNALKEKVSKLPPKQG